MDTVDGEPIRQPRGPSRASAEYEDLAAGLALLMRKQQPWLVDLGHTNVEPDTLARYGAALMIEVAEFVNELPWKLWRSRAVEQDPDLTDLRSLILGEWSDVLHFIGTWQALLWYFGISPEDTALAFEHKNRENQWRREELRAQQNGASDEG